MYGCRPNRIALRGFMVAMCLAVLAGCLPKGNPAAPIPSNLTATAGNNLVTLAWTASTGATGYNVKRATKSGGPYTQIATTTTTGYLDTTVIGGTAYFYVVSSVDAIGESANSTEASATPVAQIPTVPINLSATPGNTVVNLTWAASAGAAGYNVKRAATSGGPYTQLAAPTSNAYPDAAVSNGTTYYYVVSAFNIAGESANSAEVSAIPAIPTIPAAPTNLRAAAGDTQVSLTWSASSGATTYNVKRATTNGGPYTQIASTTSPSYGDTGLTDGTTYYYVVSAVNSAGESPNSTQVSAVPFVPNPPPTVFGTWVNVTPSNVDLTDPLCGNFGTSTVQADPANPSNLYTAFNCQGIWKSIDYGVTWTGPINTGTNGAAAGDCVGGIAISPKNTAAVPTIYEGCIRGNGIGFWKSVDGGVSWTQYFVAPGGSRQDYTAPVVDPYDETHLLMSGHEHDSLVESVDGGQTWTNVSINSGMVQIDGTAGVFFIDTGNATSTRGNWLWIAQFGKNVGTWRTSNNGATWIQVDKNENFGSSQIYQPDNNGVVFMAGINSALGSGVLRSTDYGQTWTHEGVVGNESVVLGTSKNLYSMAGFPVGISGSTDPGFEVATQPGTGAWAQPGTPAALNQGTSQFSLVNDGTHNILLGAMYNSGLWRYIEP
jgi:fibronectin type 3 domain-containing protein